jgi:hypothetical protein
MAFVRCTDNPSLTSYLKPYCCLCLRRVITYCYLINYFRGLTPVSNYLFKIATVSSQSLSM